MSTLQEMGSVSKKPFTSKLQLKEEFPIPERYELRAIGVFKITYFPRAYVEFDVQRGVRSSWGMTDKQKYKTQAQISDRLFISLILSEPKYLKWKC